MLDPQLSERQLVEQLLETLQALPDVSARLSAQEMGEQGSARRHDAELSFDVLGSSVTILVEVKKSAFPRDVREFLWQLKQSGAYRGPVGPQRRAVPLLAAESISTGAKQLLRDERVGYFDTGGSLFLPARGAYILIEKPTPKTLAKAVRSFFTGRRSQVLHAMLHRPREWFGVKELAEEAMVSPATASETLSALERFDWVIARGQGPAKERCLTEPGALLDAWSRQTATQRQPTTMRRYFVPGVSAEKLLGRVAQACDAHDAEYAVTYEAAAQCYAPFLSSLSQVRCRLLGSSAADAAIGDLDARVVNEGANLVVIEAKSHGDFLFRERVGSAWLASPVQVYLDLLRGEGRAKEMAEHLRKERIGF